MGVGTLPILPPMGLLRSSEVRVTAEPHLVLPAGGVGHDDLPMLRDGTPQKFAGRRITFQSFEQGALSGLHGAMASHTAGFVPNPLRVPAVGMYALAGFTSLRAIKDGTRLAPAECDSTRGAPCLMVPVTRSGAVLDGLPPTGPDLLGGQRRCGVPVVNHTHYEL